MFMETFRNEGFILNIDYINYFINYFNISIDIYNI